MLTLFLIGIIAAICSASSPPKGVVDWNGDGRHGLAVDFSLPTPFIGPPVFKCLREAGFTTVFLPVYNAHTYPHEIADATFNVNHAIEAGLDVEVYMVPKYHLFYPHNDKQGLVQMVEASHIFKSTNLRTRRIWIKVKSQSFDDYWLNNREFLSGMMLSAQKLGIDVGVFTNRKTWNDITNKWNLNGHPLWYWNVNNVGPGGETLANFEDFHPFGNWTEPTVKQFAKKENICGVTVNWDVYDVQGLKNYKTRKIQF